MPAKDRVFDKLVGKRLKLVRADLGFKTKRAFAGALDIDEDRYSSWEAGKNGLPPIYATFLLEKWGLSTEYLYSRDPKRLTPEYYAVKRA